MQTGSIIFELRGACIRSSKILYIDGIQIKKYPKRKKTDEKTPHEKAEKSS
jgi:hypothetical protein